MADMVLSRAWDGAAAAVAPSDPLPGWTKVFSSARPDGAKSNFLNTHGFLTSVNEEVVHGTPRRPGSGGRADIDGGAIVDADLRIWRRTVVVGTADPEDVRLAQEAMWRGIRSPGLSCNYWDAVDDYATAGHPGGPMLELRDAGSGRAELPHRPPRAEDARGCASQ